MLGDRSRFRHEFDWVGTADPTGFLTLPAAIDWMAAQAPGGWPEVMASNRALALDGRERLCVALDIEPPAPDSMIGSMATLPLPWVDADDDAAERLHDRLAAEDRIQVPIGVWPVPAARTEGVRPTGVRPDLRPALQRAGRLRQARRALSARDRDRRLTRSPGGQPKRTAGTRTLGQRRRDRLAREAGAVGVVGVVGAEGVVPDPLPDPLSPSSFGQSALVPVPFWRGAGCVPEPPEPSDGAVVLGEADGSGLAADTTRRGATDEEQPGDGRGQDASGAGRSWSIAEPMAGRSGGRRDDRGGAGCRDDRRSGPFHASLLRLGCLAGG